MHQSHFQCVVIAGDMGQQKPFLMPSEDLSHELRPDGVPPTKKPRESVKNHPKTTPTVSTTTRRQDEEVCALD